MAVIDAEGMFGGDRMAMLSDQSRWVWPWIWCASNGMGRLELNYRAIIERAFRNFTKKPTEEQFWQWITDFHKCYLMFVYEHDGKAWGQWMTSEKYLPKYKLRIDTQTPAPDPQKCSKWYECYGLSKIDKIKAKCPIISVSNSNTQKTAQNAQNDMLIAKIAIANGKANRCNVSDNFSDLLPLGVGVGVGVGLNPFEQKRRIKRGANRAESTPGFNRFWKVYWRRVGRAVAEKAFAKRCVVLRKEGKSTDEAIQFLIDKAVEDRRKFEGTEDWTWRSNLHPATWLNQQRWDDEVKVETLSPKLGPHSIMLRPDAGPTGTSGYEVLR